MRAQDSATPPTPIAVDTAAPGPVGPPRTGAPPRGARHPPGRARRRRLLPHLPRHRLGPGGLRPLVAGRRAQRAGRAHRGRLPAGAARPAARPPPLGGLAVVAAGVVFGFPLLTTLALQTSTTSHAAVVVGLLPLTTALFSALRIGRPPLAHLLGGGAAGRGRGDRVHRAAERRRPARRRRSISSAALLVCAAGYTEGGRLARRDAGLAGHRLGAGAVPAAGRAGRRRRALARARPADRRTARRAAGVAAGSQFLGLVVWYRGMAAIGIPQGQPVAAGPAAAHTGLVGAAARRAADTGRTR